MSLSGNAIAIRPRYESPPEIRRQMGLHGGPGLGNKAHDAHLVGIELPHPCNGFAYLLHALPHAAEDPFFTKSPMRFA